MKEITEEQTTHNMLMELIAEECAIDTNDVMEYPPTALSLGEKTIQAKGGDITMPIPIGTYGNFSFVQAPPKSKKTFFVSLLASVYLSGGNNFGGKIKGHREGRCLMHFDTEQGHWHAQRVFKRVQDMSNTKEVGCYHTYALRTIGYKERLQFIEHCLEQNKGKNGLVIIDGIADLVSDVNNLEESNLCVQKIMQLSAKYDCHIVTVIHSNFGSDKPTGHLGSFLEKKTENQIQLEINTVNKEWITVSCKRSRGYAFETFSFSINEFGLPFVVGEIYDPLEYFVPKTLTPSKPIEKPIEKPIKLSTELAGFKDTESMGILF
ncbi:AAA family ATPase [Flavobacteriaceae bacterium]|nr:AAA family ATPase [Flavobacteriaceae bacterium]